MRRAILQTTPEFVFDGALSVLGDAGLRCVSTLTDPRGFEPRVCLFVIEGEALPEDCEVDRGPLKVVNVLLQKEAYGRQAIVRVTDVQLTGRTWADLTAPGLAA